MAEIARAFDEQTHSGLLRGLPREAGPSNDDDLPWAAVAGGAMPPMMFQLRRQDGSLTSFAYSDLRQIHCPHAGRVELFLHAMEKLLITIDGRHLQELAGCFTCGLVRWVQEADPRDIDKPESAPQIVTITVEELAE